MRPAPEGFGNKRAYILTLLRTKNRKEPIFSTEKHGSEMHEYVHRPTLTDTKRHSIIKYYIAYDEKLFFYKLLNAQL